MPMIKFIFRFNGTVSVIINSCPRCKLLEIQSPTETTDFVYLNDEPLAMVQGSNVYYFINDTNHTPKYLTDQSNNTQWQADVKPFQVKELTANISQPLKFPGQINDATTGILYNHARDHLPTLGRFLQPDPEDLVAALL